MDFSALSLDHVNVDGETMLHYSVRFAKPSLLRFLFEKHNVEPCLVNQQSTGGNFNCAGKSVATTGWTALHFAAAAGAVETVQLLLEKGADKKLKSASKQTVADVAKAFNRENVFPLLGIAVPKKSRLYQVKAKAKPKVDTKKDGSSWHY